ncbi:hypothetical protein EVAR_88345_1 [Eumeta japonica]|uniref:Uncharacterized protein n=1 Tax=Eumeta variegata TaxID=151549 RepID=A0A4C1YCL1_EUMVA|nr:hypothetical protein EVAR_88345_1 [Eumeta japonica]
MKVKFDIKFAKQKRRISQGGDRKMQKTRFRYHSDPDTDLDLKVPRKLWTLLQIRYSDTDLDLERPLKLRIRLQIRPRPQVRPRHRL